MKLFILLPRVPYPLEKGDKLRAYHQIRLLSQTHALYLFALNDSFLSPEMIEQLKPFCKKIKVVRLTPASIFINVVKAFFTGLPLQVGYFYSNRIRKLIQQEIHSFAPDIIFAQLLRTAEYVRHIREVPKVIDYMDSFSLGMRRRIDNTSFLYKPLFSLEYTRLKKYEKNIFNDFDRHVIISAQDRECINHPQKEKIKVIPNGIDLKFFRPSARPKNTDVLFTGNMNYPPNVHAAVFLVRRVMPLVWKVKPGTKVLLCGSDPAAAVSALQSEHVVVTGWVDDTRAYYDAAKVFIAPMLLGSGLQNKLLEAMAMKLPCITTTLANKPLGALADESVLLADTAEMFADKIIFLLDNPDKAQQIAESGFRYISSRFTWENHMRALEQILAEARRGKDAGEKSLANN